MALLPPSKRLDESVSPVEADGPMDDAPEAATSAPAAPKAKAEGPAAPEAPAGDAGPAGEPGKTEPGDEINEKLVAMGDAPVGAPDKDDALQASEGAAPEDAPSAPDIETAPEDTDDQLDEIVSLLRHSGLDTDDQIAVAKAFRDYVENRSERIRDLAKTREEKRRLDALIKEEASHLASTGPGAMGGGAGGLGGALGSLLSIFNRGRGKPKSATQKQAEAKLGEWTRRGEDGKIEYNRTENAFRDNFQKMLLDAKQRSLVQRMLKVRSYFETRNDAVAHYNDVLLAHPEAESFRLAVEAEAQARSVPVSVVLDEISDSKHTVQPLLNEYSKVAPKLAADPELARIAAEIHRLDGEFAANAADIARDMRVLDQKRIKGFDMEEAKNGFLQDIQVSLAKAKKPIDPALAESMRKSITEAMERFAESIRAALEKLVSKLSFG